MPKRSASASPGHKPPSKVPRTDDPIDKALREQPRVMYALGVLRDDNAKDVHTLAWGAILMEVLTVLGLHTNAAMSSGLYDLPDAGSEILEALKKTPASFDPIRQH
ncbi:hypothetical protein EUX98_g7225, partial [Antrodiella citrinella]